MVSTKIEVEANGDVASQRSCCGCRCLEYDVRENHQVHSVSDEWDANILSHWTFQWLQPLVNLGATRPLEFEDLGELSVLDKSDRLRGQFREALDAEKELPPENRSLWRALRVSFGDLLYPALFAKVLGDLLAFVQPLALGGIIDYIAAVQDGSEGDSELAGLGYGWWWTMALVASAILQNALLQNHHHLAMRAGMRVRAAIQAAVYSKTLTIASAARELAGVGRLVNLASTDAVTIHMVPYFISYVVASPMQIILTGVLLVLELGPAALVGMVTLLLLVPVQRYLGGIIKALSSETLAKSDSRVKLVTEIIQGIKLLRMFAWEDSFDKRVTEARDQELVAKRSAAMVTGFNAFITDAAPVIVALLSFITYSYTSDEDLNARQAFTALTLFGLLRLPLLVLPMLNDAVYRAQASVDRVQGFLNLPDSEQYVTYKRDLPASGLGSSKDSEGSGKSSEDAASSDAPAPAPEALASNESAPRVGIEFTGAELAWTVEQLRQMKKDGIDVLTGQKADAPAESKPKGSAGSEDAAKEGGKSSGPDWDFKLKVPSLAMPAGKLTTVIGSIGTGKSSLLAALLGEMTLEKGSVIVHLPVESSSSGGAAAASIPVAGLPASNEKRRAYEMAYCAQSAWIMSGTIRDNILFGLPFEQEWYDEVIDACCLRSDLEKNFVAGDETEVGERGITCSGGQKARISLARAVYSRAPVVLLDDVLSAVDAHVGSRMFRDAICGLLKGRTVVFVSHQVQFLPMSDYVVLMHDGSPMASGTYHGVMSTSEEVAKIMDFARVRDSQESGTAGSADASGQEEQDRGADGAAGEEIKPADADDVKIEAEAAATSSKPVARPTEPAAAAAVAPGNPTKPDASAATQVKPSSAPGSLTKKEHRERGEVAVSVYCSYLTAMSYIGVTLIFGLLILLNALRVATDWWLTRWSTDALDETLGIYASIYAGLAAGNVFSILAYELMWAWAAMVASQQLHSDMFRRVIKAIGRWFDITPSGRIQNRFGSDVEVVDKMLPLAFSNYMKLAVQISVTLIVQAVITWQVVLGFAPLFVVYYFLQDFYRKSSRECKRLESISKSPIYNHLQETLGGLETVRSGGHSKRFEREMTGRIDNNSVAFFKLNLMNRWLGLRLDVIGGIIVGITAVTGVATAGDIDPGLVGLSITYAFAVVVQLNWLLRFSTDTEVHMASVERMLEYSEVPIEKPHVYHAGDTGGAPAPQGWPSRGSIEFKDVRMRYNAEDPEDPLVLKGLSLSIPAGSRVGVVGPTGAGKSSILVALFRYVELAGGKIEIDGVDTSTIGLRELRRAITVIPQDPVLFHETVAYNLDPTGSSSKQDMMQAVETVNLAEAVQRLGGLDGIVTEGGKNLSAGQRQLFCLARALLRKSKVLALDEATSSISKEDDELVQRMLRDQFQGVTTITIAHRINTITSSDYILAMRNGKMAEFAPPQELMEREDSLYRSLLMEQARTESR